jgi:hypothetical protein
MTTQEFIKQLSGMQVAKFENDTIYMANGLEITYRVEISEMLLKDDDMPLQMTLRISFHGAYVMTWGAGDSEDNRALVQWWIRDRSWARNKSREVEQELAKVGFTLLMQEQ